MEQLTGVAKCLPYVGGDAKVPTPYCCSGLKQDVKNNKKCICTVIQDRDNHVIGFMINLTLALGLPSLCKASDNFSQCPSLLHLDLKSAEAQSFNDQGLNNNNGSCERPAPAHFAGENSPSGKVPESDASHTEMRFLRSLVKLVAASLIWF